MTTIKVPRGKDITEFLMFNRIDTRFELEDGAYYLESAWGFDKEHDHCSLGPGCQLVGSGSNRTFIVICCEEGSVPDAATQIIGIGAGGRSTYSDIVEISGVTIILPIPVQPPADPCGTIGLQIWSDRCILNDVNIQGVTGCRPTKAGEPSSEGFGILINQSSEARNVGGSIVRDVVISVAPTKGKGEIYVTGFYPGYIDPKAHGTYENILVVNDSDVRATSAFGLNGFVAGRNWKSSGRWGWGIYCDVTGGSRSIVTDSIFEVETTALELQSETGKATKWSDIVLQNSIVHFKARDASYAAGLVLRSKDKPDSEFCRVQLRNCMLVNDGSSKITHWAGSADKIKVTDSGLRRCELVGKWNGQSTSNPGFTIT